MRNPFTHKRLEEVKDSAEDFGHADKMEARFAKGDLETAADAPPLLPL